jgi:hypothetical protein
MGFQNTVNNQQAPAVAGDFATGNPRSNVVAQEGAFVAGVGGVVVGKFAWVGDDGVTVVNHGTAVNAPDGFVHRDQQALITAYLGEASNVIPEGFPVTLFRNGDFYADVAGSTAATRGATVYAKYSDGSVTIGSAATGASATGAIGSTNTAAIGSTSTGTGSGTNLTLSSLTGYVSVGDSVSGTGVPANTVIVSQTSGTTGLAGVYVTNNATTSSAATITTFGVTLKVSATTNLISIGDTVAGGAGFPTGATIDAQVSGTTGGAGIYTMSDTASAYVASATGVTTYGTVLNITAVASGSVLVGNPVSGTGVPSGAVIDSQVSGTVGGIGVYTIDVAASAYAASTAITTTGGVATTWTCSTACAVGELTVITK